MLRRQGTFSGKLNVSLWTNAGYAGTFYRAHFYASELTAAQVQSDCGSMVAEVAGRGVQTGPVLNTVGALRFMQSVIRSPAAIKMAMRTGCAL